jgi:hypothetical protein
VLKCLCDRFKITCLVLSCVCVGWSVSVDFWYSASSLDDDPGGSKHVG